MDTIDKVALWFLVFGVWPFADPGHDLDTMMSMADFLVHVTAGGVLGARWKFVRRA